MLLFTTRHVYHLLPSTRTTNRPKSVSLIKGLPSGSTTIQNRHSSTLPLISINNGTFYRHYPSTYAPVSSNPPLFPSLTFALPTNSPSYPEKAEHWSIISPSSLSRTTLLQILRGTHLSLPPTARTYPSLTAKGLHPSDAIQYVGFDAERGGAVRGSYLSARYESRVEEEDWTLEAYLSGATELNPAADKTTSGKALDPALLARTITDLRLENHLQVPVAHLSNGQTRRARIAKALLRRPALLLLDGPFMGLDPPSVRLLSGLLAGLAKECRPQVVLSLRTGDEVPAWVTHLVAVGGMEVHGMGRKEQALVAARSRGGKRETREPLAVSCDGFPARFGTRRLGQKVVEMRGVRIAYGARTVLGAWDAGLSLQLRQGQRLAVLGPNGSGKTTLLSLITSDHPQSYAQDVKIFGRSRLPSRGERGITLFELQRRIGHASPEVHAFFPKSLTVRRALESAWADAPLARPQLGDEQKRKVQAVLAWFEPELNLGFDSNMSSSNTSWADYSLFGGLSFSAQRLLLFLRALVAGQEIVVLDEVFSGMDKVVREKAFKFMAHGTGESKDDIRGLSDEQALVVIAHDKHDMPGCIRDWICLPEPAAEGHEQRPLRQGELEGPLELNPHAWNVIWGTA